jgi:hypothetical protein
MVFMPEAVGKHWSSICAQKVLLDFLNLRTNNAGQRYREEAIEKTILRIIASCAFSRSLAPFPTFAPMVSNGSVGWVASRRSSSVIGDCSFDA